MALISTKSVYGLNAMYELMCHTKNYPLSIREMSLKIDVSQAYLEQLLNILKNHGFVKSIRGAKGGYFLNKSPNEIFIKDIFIALDGELETTNLSPKNKVVSLFLLKSDEKLNEIFNIALSEFQILRQESDKQIDYII